MLTKLLSRALMMTAMTLFLGFTPPAISQERSFLLTQHVREEARALKPVGSLPANQILHFDMLLPPGAPEELDQFLSEVYDPANAAYRRFVTPEEFAARFGPSRADWLELVNFARQSGFTILGGSRNEMDLRLAAPVRDVEAAFHIHIRVFAHPTEARTFYSPDAEPSVGIRAAVWHISGLDNYSIPKPRVQTRADRSAVPLTATGACPGNSYCGSDLRSAYYGSGALNGAGQSVGLVEFYGYDTADLKAYFNGAGQTNNVPVNGISTDGSAVTCLYSKGCDDTEQTLDITQALGMAPGLAQLNVYVGASDTAILSAMSVPPPGSVTGKVDAQISCSWGWGPSDPAVDDPLFKKFAAQGQTFFTAAGDSAAYSANSQYVYPADDANVTVVGGTDLSTTGPGGVWSAETAWADGGGGYYAPDSIAIPSWQMAAISTFNSRSGKPGSTTLRNSPDVAGEANFDFYVCADQQACSSNRYGGTSFAAPMWAGYMALANQQAAKNGLPAVGFLNAAIYAIGNASGTAYAQAFHDVTTGSNGYSAVTGYDLAAGWGSPNGAGLINALAGSGTPGFTLSSAGPVSVTAGSSAAVTLTSSVTGGFNSAISLSASGLPAGMTVNFNPASIMGAGSGVAGIQVASTVAAGSYSITLTGTSGAGTSSVKSSSVTAVLTVTAPNFSLSSGGAIAVNAGGIGNATISSAASGGLNSAVALSASGQPAGLTVAFSPSSIAGTGTSIMNVQAAPSVGAGMYPITVTGVSGSLVHTTSVNVTVSVPSFALATSTAALTITEGSSGTLAISTTAAGGFAAPVALSASGQPSGMTLSFSPASITGAGSSTATVSAAAGAAAGTYHIVITGKSGSLTQSASVTVTIGLSFTLSGTATSLSALQSASAGMTFNSTVAGGLGSPIALSVVGQPPGVTASLSTNSLKPPGSFTLNVAVASNAIPGNYPITVSGVSGNVKVSATVTLAISSPVRPTFAFSVGATSLTVAHGSFSTLAVQTAVTGAAAPTIILSASGLPSGVTTSFMPATINGAGTSTVTFTAASTATPGVSTVTLYGSSGSVTQSSTVTLTVN